jgi:hypothetical protein
MNNNLQVAKSWKGDKLELGNEKNFQMRFFESLQCSVLGINFVNLTFKI